MGRGKSLTEREVASIVAFRAAKWSIRQIAKEVNRSSTAVENALRREELCKPTVIPGRPSVVSEQASRRIIRAASNFCGSSKNIRYNLDLPFSDRTVRRVLQRSGIINYRKKSRKPILSAAQMAARVLWAEAHLNWNVQWRKIIFSDEKKFRLDGPDGNTSYYHDVRKRQLIHNKRHSGGGGVMVWGAIGWRGKSDVMLIEGNMKSEDYQEVLSMGLLNCAGRIGGANYIFMQDNATIHKSHSTMAWLEENGVRTLPWPPRSPDMNPVENMWGRLSQLVYANGKQYDNIEDLKHAIVRCWGEIGADYRKKLYNSMHNRMVEVINARGYISLY